MDWYGWTYCAPVGESQLALLLLAQGLESTFQRRPVVLQTGVLTESLSHEICDTNQRSLGEI